MKNRCQIGTKKTTEELIHQNKSVNWEDIKKGKSIQRQIAMHIL